MKCATIFLKVNVKNGSLCVGHCDIRTLSVGLVLSILDCDNYDGCHLYPPHNCTSTALLTSVTKITYLLINLTCSTPSINISLDWAQIKFNWESYLTDKLHLRPIEENFTGKVNEYIEPEFEFDVMSEERWWSCGRQLKWWRRWSRRGGGSCRTAPCTPEEAKYYERKHQEGKVQ